ncbi:MAG TPA: hypothetical protein DFS52_04520 [Myxococcales bacterium]|jgi:hypothetical protein|nr:hypothetical protein [Myxococcales bacterium]
MAWRRVLVGLHRDIGFLILGLTLVYGVSGIAVNHRHHWNPNQSVQQEVVKLGPPAELLGDLPQARREAIAADLDAMTREEERLLIESVTRSLGRQAGPKNAFWRGPDRLSLFFETGNADTVDYEPSTGTALRTRMRDRPLVRDANYLHLNRIKGAWTFVADAFALCLIFLGISGALIVRGRQGLRGRGGILALAGIVLPIVVVVLKRYL